MNEERIHLKLGDIEIFLPKNNPKAIETAKKILDILAEDMEVRA